MGRWMGWDRREKLKGEGRGMDEREGLDWRRECFQRSLCGSNLISR